MSGFASFATGNPSFCRSPPAHASQPLRTSPLKSSYIPASRNASPTPSSSSRDDGGRDDESDVGSTSHSGSDSGDEDLVFFGTPTSAEARSIARLSQAIPATPLPSTPSKRQKVVRKRDSREFLRRQTILHQPYNGCTPVKGAQQKQEEKAGRKVWPGGFFDRPLAQREDEEETDFAPTPARFGRRKTPSPTRRHEDDGLALDFGRMGLASPAVAAPEARRARRSSSLASTTSSDRSEEVLGMDVFEGCLSTDDELADSDKENCPGPDEAHSAITEQSEEGSADLFDGPVSEVLFPENSLNAANYIRELDMGSLNLTDFGDEDTGNVIESDDGHLSDSSAESSSPVRFSLGSRDEVVDCPEGLEHRFEEESRREEENEGNAEHDREESIVSPSSPARLSIERKEEGVEGKDVAKVRIEEQSRREGGNEENAERDREESSVSPSSPARLSERLSETRGEGVEGNEVTALRIEEEDQAEEGSRFPDEETDAVIEEEADPLDQTTAREEVAIDTTSSTQEAAEDDKVASPEPVFGTRVREGEEDEGAAPDDDGRAAADLSDDDAADLLEDASAPSGAEHHVHDFEADVSSNDDMDVGDVSMVDIEAVSKAVRAPETDDLDQMVPSTITAAELSSEQSSAASSSSSVIGQGEADGTSLLTPQSPFLPALTMSPGVLFQSCMSHLASSTSSSSPTTSTTSSTYSSPIPLARAAPPGVLQIPVIMPSPTRDASSSPSRAQDVDNAGLHHFAPSLLDHFGTPSAATSRAYSTPDSIRASNAANRPIRTPVPLQAYSATGPSTPTLRNSTLPTRTNAPTRAPGQAISKLARKAAITSSASGSRSGTAPDTVAKVNAQLSTRKITPEDDAVRLAALAAERERAALASVRKPLPAKSVEASQPLGAQMQRGKLNMGPPARPGSALSNSSSGSSGKGAGSGRGAGARSSDKDSASSVSARLGGVTGASARGPGARIGTGIPRPPSATQRSTATGAVSSSSSASSSGPSRSSVARPAMTSVPKMSGPKVTSITKPVINTRTILGTRDLSQSSRTPAPSASSQTFKTTTRTVLPSRVPAQSGPTSRSVIRPNAIAASSVSAPAASARTSPSKANPLNRQRPHAAPPVARSMVQVEAGVSHGSAVQTHGTQMGMRSALSGLGPAVRRVGGRLVPSAPTRETVSALQAVEDDLTPVVTDPWQGPVFDSGGYAQQLYHPGLAPVPSPARFGGIGRTGVGARAGSSSARNRMPGTPSRMGSAATPQRSQLHRTAMAGQGLISALAPAHFDGPRHFDAIPIDSDAPPAANTRLHPEDSHGQDAPSSSPPAEVRGSSEDHAEVSFMIPAAASSSEVGSSPIKQSDKAPSPPDNSTSNEEKTPSPPVTRSSSQSPSKPPKRNTTRPARATSAPATKSALSRPAVRAGQSIVPDMTEKELKSKTALNTAKNEKRVCAIDRQVINIDAPRPPSPTSKIPTTAAREEREKKMGRDERARRRKADEEEAKAGEEALVRREERVRGPGDEEGWIYEDEDRDDGQDELSDPYGPPRKRVKMGHGDREKKRVKWDKGVVVIRDFGEGLGRIRSASASASASGEGASLKSAMSLERRIELDQFGNVLPSRSTFTAKPHKVVVQAIFYQGEEPYVAPAQATRGKKKAAA